MRAKQATGTRVYMPGIVTEQHKDTLEDISGLLISCVESSD